MNPWHTPMWMLVGVLILLVALMTTSLHTSAWYPIAGIFVATFAGFLWIVHKARNYHP
jgi:hypothetical protein